MKDYDIFLFAYDPNGGSRAYVPARVRGDQWDLKGLLNFLINDVWTLARQEIYRGGSALVQVRHHNEPFVLVAYEVTGGYTRGQQWRPL